MSDQDNSKVSEVDDLIDDYDLIDEELLEEEFSDGYEEGYEAAKKEVTGELEPRAETIAESNSDSIYSKREDTRSRLAIIYTVLTFIIFFSGMLIAVVDGLARNVSIIENLEVIIPLISGVFLGTLGFVLGYYFRKAEKDDVV